MAINTSDLADDIQSLHCAYDALSNLACEARACTSEDVANVLHILNQHFDALAKQAVEVAFPK